MKKFNLLKAVLAMLVFGMLFAGCSFKTSIDARINSPFSSGSDVKYKTIPADCAN